MPSQYNGPIRLIVADLAGTTVDYGSCAPAGAFAELFERYGVSITDAEARQPMGLQKRDHIVALTKIPRIAEAWRAKHGNDPDDSTIDAMYAQFIPLQVECLPSYADLIPGVLETVDTLRARDIFVAATTGYNREMLEVVLAGAAEQGFVPDFACCAEDVPFGRPAPWMIYRCMEALAVYPPSAVITIGDTLPDVESGMNAGTWSVGISKTGNMLGLSREIAESKTEQEIRPSIEAATTTMQQHGADMVVDSFSDCLTAIEEFERRLATNS